MDSLPDNRNTPYSKGLAALGIWRACRSLCRNTMEATQTERQSNEFRIASLVMLGVAIMSLLLPAYMLISIGPVFREMFMDFQIAFPVLTSLLLSIPPNTYILLFTLLILGLIVKEVMIRNKSVTFIVNAAITAGVFPFLFFFIWAMFLPIHRAGG